jgi:hypothetical protein
MGGSDDPSNIVLLTPEEHAEAHRLLYEQYGRHQDYLAWQGLAKLKSKKEIFVEFGRIGLSRRSSTNKGIIYKTYTRTFGKGSNSRRRWFHNPSDPTQKVYVEDINRVPSGWVSGQGRKAINPGVNFRPVVDNRSPRQKVFDALMKAGFEQDDF